MQDKRSIKIWLAAKMHPRGLEGNTTHSRLHILKRLKIKLKIALKNNMFSKRLVDSYCFCFFVNVRHFCSPQSF